MLKSPQMAGPTAVVIVRMLLATFTSCAVLHSVSDCAYSPCREITVHDGLSTVPVKSSKNRTLEVSVAVKFTPLTLLLLMVTGWLVGLKVAVWLLGVTV